MTWQKLHTKQVYQNRYMTVTEEDVLTNHGDKLVYGVVHKNPFVVIIATKEDQVLLVGQYRYPIDYFSWELPMGHAESSSIQDAARAELQQETGLVAQDLSEIGTFYPAPGHLDQIGHIFVVTQYQVGKQELEPAEKGMQMKWVTLTELEKMITDGTIKDGPTLACLKIFELYNQSNLR